MLTGVEAKLTIYSDIFLWIGIFLLLSGYIGYFRKHHMRIVGYIALGIFWVGEAPYFFSISDNVNAVLCLLGLPLFIYFAYHESLSFKWDEDPEVMRFLAGGISIAMLIYYSIQRVPIAAGALIKVVADQTAWLGNLMGYEFTAMGIDYAGNPLFYRINHEEIRVSIRGSGVAIIFACTALQTLAPAFSLIATTTAEVVRKAKALLIVLPTIYIANLGRNLLVIYLTIEGITSFEVAHHQVAKIGSVLVLIILMLIVFEMMPKFHDNIISVISLPKREPLSAGDDGNDA